MAQITRKFKVVGKSLQELGPVFSLQAVYLEAADPLARSFPSSLTLNNLSDEQVRLLEAEGDVTVTITTPSQRIDSGTTNPA